MMETLIRMAAVFVSVLLLILSHPANAASPAVSLGASHTCRLADVGTVQCWGSNEYGQLGDGTDTDSTTPVTVMSDGENVLSGVTAISVGLYHTCALITNGTVLCWGNNEINQLGNGTGDDEYSTTPVTVMSDGENVLTGVTALSSTNGDHTCALTTAGTVKCWGYNGYGQLGNQTDDYYSITPVTVMSNGENVLSGVTAITAGELHTCALTTNGTVQCWGGNEYGQLGDGTDADSTTPVTVMSDGENILSGVTAISAGAVHTCALTVSGTVKCWGLNGFGQLGNDSSGTGPHPTPVAVMIDDVLSDVTAISSGGLHTCALTTAGMVKCWGLNEFGQLGNDSSDTDPHPTPVTVMSDGDDGVLSGVTAIEAGINHTCALTDTGMKCWGKNSSGQLGDETNDDSFLPVDVIDRDGDGFFNEADNCPLISNSSQFDTDFDETGDACDDNDDNDANTDAEEVLCGSDPVSASSTCANLDSDGDGTPNVSDNCPIANADQLNTDGDSQGNACDTTPNGPDTDGGRIAKASEAVAKSDLQNCIDSHGAELAALLVGKERYFAKYLKLKARAASRQALANATTDAKAKKKIVKKANALLKAAKALAKKKKLSAAIAKSEENCSKAGTVE
jgi:alpha-tubulin suppressor-like RCC1 family protein